MRRRIGLRTLVFVSIVGFALSLPSIANSSAYLVIVNTDDGQPIAGQVITPDGVPEAMVVEDFHHLVVREPDQSHSGYSMPQHRPLVVTVPMGFSAGRLFEAFGQANVLDVRLMVYWQNQREFDLFLQQAHLVAIEPTTLTRNGQVVEYLKLRFVYLDLTVEEIATSLDMRWQLQSWPY